MGKATGVNVNGTERPVKNAWIKVNGDWKQRVMPKGKISGSWKELMSYFENYIYRSARDNISGKDVGEIEIYNSNLELITKIDIASKIGYKDGIVSDLRTDDKNNIYMYVIANESKRIIYQSLNNKYQTVNRGTEYDDSTPSLYKLTPINKEPQSFVASYGYYDKYRSGYCNGVKFLDSKFNTIWKEEKIEADNLFSVSTADRYGNIFFRYSIYSRGTYIAKYSPEGKHIKTVEITSASSISNVGIEYFNGYIYTGYYYNMYKYDSDLNLISTIGLPKSHPKTMTINSIGEVFLSYADDVYKISKDNKVIKFASEKAGSITIDKDDSVYIAHESSLTKYDKNGVKIASIPTGLIPLISSVCSYPGLYGQYGKE